MDKERKGRQIRRNNAWRKVMMGKRQADYWRKRWETHPETMRSNLDRINGTRREKAEERTKRLLRILELCPTQIMSWDLKTTLESAIANAGYALKAGSFKTLMAALRRRQLIAYDAATFRWSVKR